MRYGIFVLLLMTPLTSLARDLVVPDRYPAIGAALAAAQTGDRVRVRPGTYREWNLTLKAGVAVEGLGGAPEDVIVDALSRGRVCAAERLASPAALINLTLAGGLASGPTYLDGSGGGLLLRDCMVILHRVRFLQNTAVHSGGGLRAIGATPILSECRFDANCAGEGGGAFDCSYGSGAQAQSCAFTGNTAKWGGAVSVRGNSAPSFSDCAFNANLALETPAMGGGIYLDHDASVSLQFCTFVANAAAYGGAAAADREGSVDFVNCTLRDNLGGGLYVKTAFPTLDHTIVAFNTGLAVTFTSSATRPDIEACDIYGNTGGDWAGILRPLRYQNGNLAADPLFCDSTDFGIQESSPCAPANSHVGLIGAGLVGCSTLKSAVAPQNSLSAAPNPFNPRTSLVFSLDRARAVTLRIYDVRGRFVATLAQGPLAAGRHEVLWNGRDEAGRDVASGSYLAILQADDLALNLKLLLLR